MAKADEAGHFGTTIELAAPTMPTITIKLHEWKKGWNNRPYWHAANSVFLVMKGSGRSTIADKSFDWEFGDTFAAPAWSRIEHHAGNNAVIFSMSDENLMRWTRYYRLEAIS